ncbi:MAG: Lrp/AsnC family transcriptional regulator [Elusimicrobia bacterium]|nr:Lrp/AsnC family transcriptional regulator [Elusimicrobiota bacterium]
MNDKLEQMLLKELTRDARASYRELAKKLGVSTGTVIAKTRELEKRGVIRGYSAVLDHEKMGYGLAVVMEITVSKGKLVEMEKNIACQPNVLAVYDVTGQTDAVVVAKFRSREELSRFTKSMLALPFVERTNTHFVLSTVKEDFRLT